MKRRTLLFLLLPVLMGASLCLADAGESQTAQAAKILAQYPQTEAFKFFTRPLQSATKPQGNFKSVWFRNGESDVATHCYIDATGRIFTAINVYNWAREASFDWQLTPKQMAELNEALQDMPPNAAQPTIKNLLVVNFLEAGQPATRVYDRSQLPPQIVKLYQTLGASTIAGSSLETERAATPAS